MSFITSCILTVTDTGAFSPYETKANNTTSNRQITNNIAGFSDGSDHLDFRGHM